MKIIVMRLGTSNFGKIGTYNVQEVGLANALIKKGHDVTVLYLNRPVSEITKDETYDFVYYLPHKHIGLHGIFDTKLLEKFSPEKIILFSDNQLWAKNVILWSKKHGVTCIHYFGNVLSDNPKWLHQFYTKLILMRNRKSYNYSLNAAKTKKVMREMDFHKVPCKRVINVGLDDTILRPNVNLDRETRKQLGFKDDELTLLFVGRLVGYKKPVMACKILEELLKSGVKTRLVIIGKGPLEQQLLDYVKENHLDECVNYVGRVPYEEMYKYFVASDCIINLSAQEIFGMTILEAMYYGLPVVAHTAPGPNDIIEDGVTGYLLDSDDITVWKDCVLKAVRNRETLGKASRDEITSHYLWDSIADDFLNLK